MPKRKSTPPICLSNVMGTVTELQGPGKAIVSFSYKGVEEHALLYIDRLFIGGKLRGNSVKYHQLVHIGSVVKFMCQSYSEYYEDQSKWFITNAWRLHPFDVGSPNAAGFRLLDVIFGLNATRGRIIEVTAEHCMIYFTNCNGEDEVVLAPASNIHVRYKKKCSKKNVKKTFPDLPDVDDVVTFDAIPSEPSENPKECKWLATRVYRGGKPPLDCDIAPETPHSCSFSNLLGYIRKNAFDSNSVFIKGNGRIVRLINEEFGVALIKIRANHSEHMLFHRSCVSHFGFQLTTENIADIFQEDDMIKYIAVPSPNNKLGVRWLATQLCMDSGPTLEEEILYQVKNLRVK